jgi:hypothetical protein
MQLGELTGPGGRAADVAGSDVSARWNDHGAAGAALRMGPVTDLETEPECTRHRSSVSTGGEAPGAITYPLYAGIYR